MPDLTDLNQRMDELNEPLSLWYAQVRAESKEIFEAEPLTADNLIERAGKALRIAREHAGDGPWASVHGLLDELCMMYLRSRTAQRHQIRTLVHTYPSFARAVADDYFARACEQLEATRDPQWLSLALAAISIDNNATDFRDTYRALAQLYLTAVGVGMNPDPAFRKIARLSAINTKGSTSAMPMRWFLGLFHHSSYFNTEVRPQLHRYRRHNQSAQPWWTFWRHR